MGRIERAGQADRLLVVAAMVGAFWALFVDEALELRRSAAELSALAGPDWDVRGAAGSHVPAPPDPYPRALRQARGIGRTRALELARYYHREGVDAPADAVRGVGPATSAAAAEIVSRLLSNPRPVDSSGGLGALTVQPRE